MFRAVVKEACATPMLAGLRERRRDAHVSPAGSLDACRTCPSHPLYACASPDGHVKISNWPMDALTPAPQRRCLRHLRERSPAS